MYVYVGEVVKGRSDVGGGDGKWRFPCVICVLVKSLILIVTVYPMIGLPPLSGAVQETITFFELQTVVGAVG